MKIAITGGRGFIGSNIIKRLSLENNNIFLIEKQYIKSEVIEFNPDVIIHCGWYGGNSYKDINDPNQFSKNIDYGIQLIEILKEIPKKTKFIGFGSFAEYGDKDFIIDEKTQETPIDFYGLSKYMFKKYSELVCQKNNIDFVWIRPCYVYGPYDVTTRLIPSIINKCLNNEEIILDECNKIIDYIYVDDFIEMFYLLLKSNNIGTYNICSNKQYKLKDVINLIKTLSDSKSNIIFDSKLNRNSITSICGSNKKITEVINYNLKIDLESGLRKTISYHK
jgi:nucleoside-diphosphate-sugar epimerase